MVKAYDKLNFCFEEKLGEYMFNEMSPAFLRQIKGEFILKGTPLPMKQKDFMDVMAGKGNVTLLTLARDMGFIIGANPAFPLSKRYIEFLQMTFNNKAGEVLLNEGFETMNKGDKMTACAYLRASLYIEPDTREGLYLYAMCCRDIYNDSDDEQTVGTFKAEALENFEKLTLKYPDYPFGHYYLGYAYLNLGLYKKAQLEMQDFLETIEKDELKDQATSEIEEIKERLEALEGPVDIEQGVLAVEAGRYIEGIEILSKYADSDLGEWWPLHYYLGIAYEVSGDAESAIASLKRALDLSPSNLEVMDELVGIYNAIGDKENETKYSRKIQVVKNNLDLEKLEGEDMNGGLPS